MTTEHAGECRKGVGARMERDSCAEGGRRCGQGVFHIMLARKWHHELHEFCLVAHTELNRGPDRLEVRALHAYIVFKAEVEFTAGAELLGQRVRVIHNQNLAVIQNVVAELEEDFLEFVHFLVVLVHPISGS